MRSSSKPLQALPLVARARRPRLARHRHRLRVAPGDPGADRRRPRPARQGARGGGRARARPPGGPAAASGSSTTAPASTPACSPSAVPTAGTRGLPASRAPRPAGVPRGPRRGRRAGRGRARDRHRRLRRRHVRAAARADGARLLPPRAACRKARGSPTPCAPIPELVGGPDGADFRLMRGRAGLVREGRRRGPALRRRPRRVGLALKCEDGASRPHGPRSPLCSAGSGSICPRSPRRLWSTPGRTRGRDRGRASVTREVFLYETVNAH